MSDYNVLENESIDDIINKAGMVRAHTYRHTHKHTHAHTHMVYTIPLFGASLDDSNLQ